ncbi:MAG TPA: histidinol dehydrogenase, partial [Gammaproteobacteria bacterium]|nr:histidinol dehydrogenase [Gammaproteobacteria bacterium]
MINKLDSSQPDFQSQLQSLLSWEGVSDKSVESLVNEIITNIRNNGDSALLDYSVKFDNISASAIDELVIDLNETKSAFEGLPEKEKDALQVAAERVRDYHKKQQQDTWTYEEEDGTILGQKVTPINRVGLYVPGGKAAYPSSVLMNAIPAKVAGVNELIMVVPTPSGVTNQLVLAAAYISGVDKVFTIGGAQAIAALAYGT